MATATDPEVLDVEPEAVEPAVVPPFENYEVVDGQFVEEPPLGARESWIASRLVRSIVLFDPPGRLGNLVDETLFILERTPRLRRRPDLAFVSAERWPIHRSVPKGAAWDVIPDLAIEIVSPSDLVSDVMDKIEEYFRVGVRLLWVVYPDYRKVYVYQSSTSAHILADDRDLEGGDVLPGFKLPLARLFETTEDEPAPAA